MLRLYLFLRSEVLKFSSFFFAQRAHPRIFSVLKPLCGAELRALRDDLIRNVGGEEKLVLRWGPDLMFPETTSGLSRE